MGIFKRSPEFRIPTEVSREDWEKKYNMYREVLFSKKEVEFFNRFSRDHLVLEPPTSLKEKLLRAASGGYVRSDGYLCTMGNFLMKGIDIYNRTDILRWKIIKLDDDWYLIHYYEKSESIDISRYYICDEWEEVIGYLVNKGNRKHEKFN